MLKSLHEFRSRPGVSTVAAITLALGVAGATSMFAMLGAIGGAMVPAGVDPARIGRVVWTALDESGARGTLTAEEFGSLVAGTSAFESLALWSNESAVVGDDGPTVSVQRISPEFLRTLRFGVSAGREFARDEYHRGRIRSGHRERAVPPTLPGLRPRQACPPRKRDLHDRGHPPRSPVVSRRRHRDLDAASVFPRRQAAGRVRLGGGATALARSPRAGALAARGADCAADGRRAVRAAPQAQPHHAGAGREHPIRFRPGGPARTVGRRAPDCLRQRGEPASGASGAARTRDGGAGRTRCEPLAADPRTPGRERLARRRGRRARDRSGVRRRGRTAHLVGGRSRVARSRPGHPAR